MSDLHTAQDLIDSLSIRGAVGFPLDLIAFCPPATELGRIASIRSTDPEDIRKQLYAMYMAIGPAHMEMLYDQPHGVEDSWVARWCPQPTGCRLEAANCPAGATPLWCNGEKTVYAQKGLDDGYNDIITFGVCDYE